MIWSRQLPAGDIQRIYFHELPPLHFTDHSSGITELFRFQVDLESDHKKYTVEVLCNKDRGYLKQTPKLSVLFHGFGVDALSMKSFFQTLNNRGEPFICPNLLGAGSIFPSDFAFTPQNICKIYTDILQQVSPQALTLFGFGNSMGGMFMEGTRCLLSPQVTFHRTFINSMGLHPCGGNTEQKWPEPKTSAFLYQFLCLAARTKSLRFLSILMKFSFASPFISALIRYIYSLNLYNKPSVQDQKSLKEIFLRKTPPDTMQPLEIMANMAFHTVLPGSVLWNTKSAWQRFVGNTFSQNKGETWVICNSGDAVFSSTHAAHLAQQAGSRLHILEGGSHLPDISTAEWMTKTVFENTSRTSGMMGIREDSIYQCSA